MLDSQSEMTRYAKKQDQNQKEKKKCSWVFQMIELSGKVFKNNCD